MNTEVIKMIDQIVEDRKALRSKMIWEMDSNSMAIMSAFMFAASGKTADVEKYAACKKMLKKKVSVFSEFRGIAFTMVVTKMVLSNNPEEYLEGALAVYKKLREKHKLTASANMVLAALTIYENGGVEKADENIEKLEQIYADMKKKHPILTGDDDRGFIAMIVASGADSEAIGTEIEECYKANKKLTINKEAVQRLSQVLSLSSKSTQQKALEVQAMVDGFKKAKKRVSKDFGLPALGAMVLMDTPVDEIIPEVVEIDEYLKKQPGFKWYSTNPQIRRMYAQVIYMLVYFKESNSMITSIMASTIAMIIMEEIIMMIMINSAIISTSHSSSSSN